MLEEHGSELGVAADSDALGVRRATAYRCLARYCARNPVALERLEYSAAAKKVSYRSDKAEGPTARTDTLDPLEFLARLVAHIPDKGQVMTRYYILQPRVDQHSHIFLYRRGNRPG